MRLVDIEGRHGADWADDLETHRDLWDAAMPHADPGICLRDLKHGYHPDTLYILTTADRLADLLVMTADWHPDETEVLKGQDMGCFIGVSSPDTRSGSDPRRTVRLWWD